MLNLQRLHYKYYEMLIKAPFGSCKSISRKYSIFQKCYFSERKMFSCVWLHFKKCFEKYFLMFGCVIENIIKNTFSTCCTHFLLVAHIFSVAKRIYNIIHSSKYKQNPEKKSSNSDTSHNRDWREGEISAISTDDLDDRSFRRSRRAWLWTISTISSFFLPLSLSLALSLFCTWPRNGLKVKWRCKTISGSKE